MSLDLSAMRMKSPVVEDASFPRTSSLCPISPARVIQGRSAGTVRHVKATTLLLPAVLLALSCTPDQAREPVPTPAASSTVAGGALPSALATPGDTASVPNAERQQPLTRLGSCDDPPADAGNDPVEGLVLPDAAIVTQVSAADPLTNVQGYIEMTPVQVRAFYQEHPDVEVISVEDEVFEAELLFESGDWRVFVKSQAVCELGSVFVAVVSPAGQ